MVLIRPHIGRVSSPNNWHTTQVTHLALRNLHVYVHISACLVPSLPMQVPDTPPPFMCKHPCHYRSRKEPPILFQTHTDSLRVWSALRSKSDKRTLPPGPNMQASRTTPYNPWSKASYSVHHGPRKESQTILIPANSTCPISVLHLNTGN